MNSVFVNTEGLYQRRRAYNMSYRNDFTCNLGEIIPCYWQDLMPNTSWTCRVHGLVRFMPLIAPIMDNIDFYCHFWQSPDRILYGEEFTKMITGELEAEDWPGIYFTPKHVLDSISGFLPARDRHYLLGEGSIFDMLGYDDTLFSGPFGASEGKLNARKFIMYFRLISSWYTNENIEPYAGFKEDVLHFDDQSFLDFNDSGDISELIVKIVVNFYYEYGTAGFSPHLWAKDYFTSALPTLQFGSPTYLPLGDSAPVTIPINPVQLRGNSSDPNRPIQLEMYTQFQPGTNPELRAHNIAAIPSEYVNFDTGTSNFQPVKAIFARGGLTDDRGNPVEGIADLRDATAITINELRVANALQVFKEREMRFGRKAPEFYKGFYGVSPGDLRLQLPKFLGGGKMPVNIADIEQTSQTNGDKPLGTLAGKGTALAGGFAKAHCFSPEEALIIGLCWLMPKITYSNMLSRHDSKLNDRFLYYNPSFAHIGEQEVFNYEVFAGSYGSVDGNVEFGYQPRFTEYRFHANEMHGEFKTTLAYWTLGRRFDVQPALNRRFVYMQPRSMQRIFNAEFDSNDHMIRNVLCSLKFSVAMLQPLSRYGTPGLLA